LFQANGQPYYTIQSSGGEGRSGYKKGYKNAYGMVSFNQILISAYEQRSGHQPPRPAR